MTNQRYEDLKQLLDRENYFKMICGAGNEDKEYVKKLAFIYTLAYANVLDVSANVEVVEYASQGIDMAYKIAPRIGVDIPIRPYIMVSIGMPGDHHVRKSYIEPTTCIACGLCPSVCPTSAIPKLFHKNLEYYKSLGGQYDTEDQKREIVIKDLCIGCGKCSNICPRDNIISYRHNAKELKEILPKCLETGAECFELHAATNDNDITIKEWETINEVNPNNFNSICLDRLHLGNFNLENRIENIRNISGAKLIVQTDGYPMSGGEDDYNTTLQAVACADVINKKFNMKINKKRNSLSQAKAEISSKRTYKTQGHNTSVYVVLSGGTNHLTRKLAAMSGVRINGVAIGTYARDIVERYVNNPNIFTDYKVIREAVSVARDLVQSNIRGDTGGK